MGITTREQLSHWNYFLALEQDLGTLSRFVELSAANFAAYSIEIAHLLLAASSEVDVVLRQLCSRLSPGAPAANIDGYRRIITVSEPAFAKLVVSLPRFGLDLTPWDNWQHDRNPDWWSDYNKVKHARGEHFAKANVKNVLNAMGGLLMALISYYRGQAPEGRLVPAPEFFMAPREVINRAHSLGGETGLYYPKPAN